MSSISFQMIFSTLVIISAFILYGIQSEGLEIPRHHRDDQILNQMLSLDRYDSRLRPEAHTIVNVSLTFLTISSPTESSLIYEIEFLLHLKWNDFRLKYEDRGRHKYLNALKHSEKLWLPDLYFIKHGKMSHKNVNDIIALKIYNNGDIHFTNRYDMQIICSGNSRIFPFDSPKCNLAIESKFSQYFNKYFISENLSQFMIDLKVTQDKHQLQLLWSQSESITKSESFSSTNAYLLQNTTTICTEQQSWRLEYSCLSAVFYFIRDKSYYLSVYFTPTIVLVSLTFIAFWLSIESLPFGRIVFNLSSLLGLIILFVSFRTHLPVVSNMTAINLWEFISMLFVSLANIEFVIQINKNKRTLVIYESEYRQRLPSKGVPEEVEMREPLCEGQSIEMTRVGSQVTQTTSDHKTSVNPFNNRNSFDNFSKFVFPILYYFFVLIYFLVFGLIKSENISE